MRVQHVTVTIVVCVLLSSSLAELRLGAQVSNRSAKQLIDNSTEIFVKADGTGTLKSLAIVHDPDNALLRKLDLGVPHPSNKPPKVLPPAEWNAKQTQRRVSNGLELVVTATFKNLQMLQQQLEAYITTLGSKTFIVFGDHGSFSIRTQKGDVPRSEFEENLKVKITLPQIEEITGKEWATLDQAGRTVTWSLPPGARYDVGVRSGLKTGPPKPCFVSAPAPLFKRFSFSGYEPQAPQNWSSNSIRGNAYALAPDCALSREQGRIELTHGLILEIDTASSTNLLEASESVVARLMKENPAIRRQSTFQPVTISQRSGLGIILSSVNGITKEPEDIRVYITRYGNRDLFVMMAIAPRRERTEYDRVFQGILSTVRINN